MLTPTHLSLLSMKQQSCLTLIKCSSYYVIPLFQCLNILSQSSFNNLYGPLQSGPGYFSVLISCYSPYIFFSSFGVLLLTGKLHEGKDFVYVFTVGSQCQVE